MKTSSATGLTMPDDFPVEPYNAIYEHLRETRSTNVVNWDQYAGAWNAISYRFLALSESDVAYTESIKKGGPGPPSPERYVQEKELFSFFLNGLATLESFCYGMFAVGSIVDGSRFKMNTEADLRRIDPEAARDAFRDKFPADNFSKLLEGLVSSDEFKDWNRIRNILAHRAVPLRAFSLSVRFGQSDSSASWKLGMSLDTSTTLQRRAWLSTVLKSLLEAAHDFVQTHVH